MVPKESATFDGHTVAKQVECPNHDHLDMLDGKSTTCNNGLTLLDSVASDLNEIYNNSNSGNSIPLPTSQQYFTYEPILQPVTNIDPAQAKPVGVGSVATGGDTVSLRVSLAEFSGPVDIYLGIYAPSIDPNIWLIKPDLNLQPLSEGLVPWKVNTTGPIDDPLYGDIPVSSLPEGDYYPFLYIEVAPSGSTSAYYLWMTYFAISNPDTTPPSVPTGLTATAISSSQIDLSWNASTDNIGVVGYKVYRNGTYLKSVTTTSTSDTGLNANTQYCYTISAYDAAGNESGQSNQSCATTGQSGGGLTGSWSGNWSSNAPWVCDVCSGSLSLSLIDDYAYGEPYLSMHGIVTFGGSPCGLPGMGVEGGLAGTQIRLAGIQGRFAVILDIFEFTTISMSGSYIFADQMSLCGDRGTFSMNKN